MFRMSTVKRAGNVYVVVTLARDATRPIKSARNGIKLLNKKPIDTWAKEHQSVWYFGWEERRRLGRYIDTH